MHNGSLTLGRFRGIPIHIHWSVILLGVLFGNSLAGEFGAVAASITLVVFLGSILAHELAHALVARRYGVGTESIQLWALGGVARLTRESPTPRAEAMIAAAGPLTSLGLGAAAIGSAFALDAVGTQGTPIQALAWLGIINVILGVFNLLPGAPLDGGRIVRAWRWKRHGDRYRASREAADAGKAIGWSIAGIGGVMLLNDRPGLMLIVTGVFIAVNAKAESMAADTAEHLDGVHVRDLTWFGIAHATTDTDADTMWFQRSRLGPAGVVAVEGDDGNLAGIVTEAQLSELPPNMRSRVRLSTMMVPFSSLAQAGPDEDLATVLSRLDPRRPLVTVWHEGKLLGVVPEQRLLARLKRPA
jgi:Zn-dependent protease